MHTVKCINQIIYSTWQTLSAKCFSQELKFHHVLSKTVTFVNSHCVCACACACACVCVCVSVIGLGKSVLSTRKN